MPSRKGWTDWIPRSGEGRALVEVKGRVGGKGAGMRRNFRGRKAVRNYSQLKFAPMNFNNVSWTFDKVNLLWRPNTASDSAVQRVFTFSFDTPLSDELTREVFVKQIEIDLMFMTVVGHSRIGGVLSDFSGAQRDDIPFPGMTDVTGGYTGALMGGTWNEGSLQGPSSAHEGMPFSWALIYQDGPDSDAAIGDVFAAGNVNTFTRGKQIFDSGTLCPTLYAPSRLKVTKRFTGRGVRLSNGTREIASISLIVWGDTSSRGSSWADGLSFWAGKPPRVMYQDND